MLACGSKDAEMFSMEM